MFLYLRIFAFPLRFELKLPESKSEVLTITLRESIEPFIGIEPISLDYKASILPLN